MPRIHADVGQHAGDVDVICGSEQSNGNAFPLEIPNRPDSFVSEELVAAAVNAGEQDEGLSAIECRDQLLSPTPA